MEQTVTRELARYIYLDTYSFFSKQTPRSCVRRADRSRQSLITTSQYPSGCAAIPYSINHYTSSW